MVSFGRPIRLLITCLIAIGLSAGEPCLCGSSVAGGSNPSTARASTKRCCCCAKHGRVCHCGSGCCGKSVPEKNVPLHQNNRNNDTSSVAKTLSHYVIALASVDADAGVASGRSPGALAALTTSSTLQLQHVRLQI